VELVLEERVLLDVHLVSCVDFLGNRGGLIRQREQKLLTEVVQVFRAHVDSTVVVYLFERGEGHFELLLRVLLIFFILVLVQPADQILSETDTPLILVILLIELNCKMAILQDHHESLLAHVFCDLLGLFKFEQSSEAPEVPEKVG